MKQNKSQQNGGLRSSHCCRQTKRWEPDYLFIVIKCEPVCLKQNQPSKFWQKTSSSSSYVSVELGISRWRRSSPSEACLSYETDASFLRDAAFPAAAGDTPASALKRQLASFFSSASPNLGHFSSHQEVHRDAPERLFPNYKTRTEAAAERRLPPFMDPRRGATWSWSCSRTSSFSQSEKQGQSYFLSACMCSLKNMKQSKHMIIVIAYKLTILGIWF